MDYMLIVGDDVLSIEVDKKWIQRGSEGMVRGWRSGRLSMYTGQLWISTNGR